MFKGAAQAQHRFYLIVILVGIYTLLPFLLLSFYNHPSADDFEFAVRDNQSSFFEVQADTYINWSGRYFATATSQVNPTRFESFIGYKVYSFLLLVCFILMSYSFISSLLEDYNLMQKSALVALISVLYISQLPSVAQGLYWISASQTYLFANVLVLLLLLLLVRLFHVKDKVIRLFCTLGSVVVCAAIVGSNELSLVCIMTSLAFLLFQLWRHQHPLRGYVFVIFMCSLVASLVVVLAPGNYARMGLTPHDSKNFTWSVMASALLIPVYFYKWGILLTVASVLYILLWQQVPSSITGSLKVFNVPLWLSLLHFAATLFLMSFVFTWSKGAVPKPRVENVIYFFFVLGWFFNLQVAINKFSVNSLQLHSALILKVAMLLLFGRLVLDINNNISTAYLDLLSGKAAMYNSALNNRYEFLRSSECRVCVVEPLPAIPKSLFVEDVTHNVQDKDFLVNRVVRTYWGKEGIYLEAPNPAKESNNLETLQSIGRRVKYKLLGE